MSVGASLGQEKGKKKQRAEQVTTLGELSPEQQALQDALLNVSGEQLQSLFGEGGIFNLLQGNIQDLFSPEAQAGLEERIGRAGQLTPEESRLIEEEASLRLESGRSDIQSFLGEGLGLLRQTLAPSRGLRPSDSPIIDRGGLLLQEAIRQQGQLGRSVGAETSRQKLQFPLQRQAFQETLRNQAFTNRLNLFQTGGGFAQFFNPLQLQGLGLQERIAGSTIRTKGRTDFSGTTAKVAGQFGPPGVSLGL